MKVDHIAFLLEEESMKILLEALLPGVLPGNVSIGLHPMGGRKNMHTNIVSRLRGYARISSVVIFVLEDQDRRNCHEVKRAMEDRASQAGLGTRSHPRSGEWKVVNRVVIPRLEVWYFGDWNAVCQAYPRVPSSVPRRAPYRNPDAIVEPDKHLLRILKEAGYLAKDLKDLPKVEVARVVGPYMEPSRNTSRSFQVFYRALQSLFSE